MTTPGGDVGDQGASRPVEPVAQSRGFDGVAVLAWAGAVVFVLALAGLPFLVFQLSPQGRVLGDWWKSAAAAPPKDDERLPVVLQPLPGEPPVHSPGDVAAGREGASKADGVVVNPSWAVPPRPGFPERAQRMGVETGRVELQCPVKADGTIPSCWILSETPAGAGFAEAALIGAVEARVQPRLVDGLATGGMVRFAVNFRLQ